MRRRLWLGSELVFAVVTTVLAVLAAGHGTVWVAVAWAVGNTVSGIVAAVALRRRPAPAARAEEPVESTT